MTTNAIQTADALTQFTGKADKAEVSINSFYIRVPYIGTTPVKDLIMDFFKVSQLLTMGYNLTVTKLFDTDGKCIFGGTEVVELTETKAVDLEQPVAPPVAETAENEDTVSEAIIEETESSVVEETTATEVDETEEVEEVEQEAPANRSNTPQQRRRTTR
jgi:hypothetical protein